MADDEPRAPAPAGHRVVGGTGRFTIHAFASPGIGSVNNYWVETPDAVVVFDAQRQLSQARLALAAIERLGKPIRAIFLSHEHPDHVGGLEVFRDAAAADVPIYGSAETSKAIAANEFGYYGLAHGILGDDFPETPLRPTQELVHGQRLEIDGVAFEIHEFGPGEAAAMTTLKVGDGGDFFAADIVANGMTPFVIEGRMLRWIDQLAEFGTALPEVRTAYPGHGNPAGAEELVAAQAAYLTGFRDLVQDAAGGGGALDDRSRALVVAEVERRYPGYLPVADVPNLLAISADTISRELSARAGSAA